MKQPCSALALLLSVLAGSSLWVGSARCQSQPSQTRAADPVAAESRPAWRGFEFTWDYSDYDYQVYDYSSVETEHVAPCQQGCFGCDDGAYGDYGCYGDDGYGTGCLHDSSQAGVCGSGVLKGRPAASTDEAAAQLPGQDEDPFHCLSGYDPLYDAVVYGAGSQAQGGELPSEVSQPESVTLELEAYLTGYDPVYDAAVYGITLEPTGMIPAKSKGSELPAARGTFSQISRDLRRISSSLARRVRQEVFSWNLRQRLVDVQSRYAELRQSQAAGRAAGTTTELAAAQLASAKPTKWPERQTLLQAARMLDTWSGVLSRAAVELRELAQDSDRRAATAQNTRR